MSAQNPTITVNCGACGREFGQFEVFKTKVGVWELDVCNNCLGNDPLVDYKSAAELVGFASEETAENCYRDTISLLKTAQQTDSPDIVIEPLENLIQQAVNQLKQRDPNYFKGVTKIVSHSGPAYGHVESGPGKDPTVINLDFPRIKREVESEMGGSDRKSIDEAIIDALIDTIAHEKGHVQSFDPQTGFVGGESPAEAEAQKMKAVRGK